MTQQKMTLARMLLAELEDDPEALEALREKIAEAEAERLLKTDEAAKLLGVHPKTLVRAAAAGRVDGAIRVGSHSWRYRASELKLNPPEPKNLGPAGAGRRAARTVGESPATSALRGTARKAA